MKTTRVTIQEFTLMAPATDHAASVLTGENTLRAALTAGLRVPEAGDVRWRGVIGMEGTLTGDGRTIEPNALLWENLPLALRWVSADVGAHDGAVVVGRITDITRGKNGRIEAEGDFDTGSAEGREAARQVEAGLTRGVSMDLDSVNFEVRIAKELFDEMNEIMFIDDEEGPAVEDDEDKDEDEDEDKDENEDEDKEDEEETDSEGRVKVAEINADDEIMATTSARIRAATLVAIPAFAETLIELIDEAPGAEEDEEDDSDSDEDEDEDDEADDEDLATVTHITAGGYPIAPPKEFFSNPSLSEPTPLTVTEDGRIFGHLAVWGTCHTAYSGECVTPPNSNTNYAYFRKGSVMLADGSEVATGAITLDTLHAGQDLNSTATIAHYENTGRAVADIAVGDDDYGIWYSGALRPKVTDEQVRSLRASPLSGDWRRMGGGLELVAALAVNVPGFPIPRPKGLVASGVMTSLTASGMIAPAKVVAPGQPGALSIEDLKYLKQLANRERRQQERIDSRAAVANRRARGLALSMRVKSALK